MIVIRCMLVALVVAPSLPAWGAPSRVAVVVGNNYAKDKPRLRYAERDAQRVADVLRELGGATEVKLLLGRGASEVASALVQVGQAIPPGDAGTVIFFYSGHADDHGLLLGSTRYRYQALRGALKHVQARVAIAFIDACQSGGFVRTKGGRAVPAVNVRFDDEAGYRGHVFVSSSAAGESSQESDTIQASFFTHYLVSALRGAADDSGDGLVSLEEAYRYVYQRTLERTASTLAGPQHATYDMAVTGRGQLVLTEIARSATGVLALPAALRGVVHIRSPRGVLLAEVRLDGRRRRLAFPPGAYEVRVRSRRALRSAMVTLAASSETVLSESRLRPVRLEVAVAKGAGDERSIRRTLLDVGYTLNSGYLDGSGLLHGARLGLARSLGRMELGGLLSYAGSRYQGQDQFRVRLDEVGAAALLGTRFRLASFLQLFVGLEAGGGVAFQSAAQPDGASPVGLRRPFFRYQGRVGVELRMVDRLSAVVAGSVGQIVVERQDGVAGPLQGGLELGLLLRL